MKEKILGWVFKDYKRGLDENLMLEKRMFKASVDAKDVVRERLKGIRPGSPQENSTWLLSYVAGLPKPERLEFLSNAHTIITGNKAFKVVVDYLITEAMRKATLEADSYESVNFQRATINGLELLEEELSYLSRVYEEVKKLHDLITVEESFEAA